MARGTSPHRTWINHALCTLRYTPPPLRYTDATSQPSKTCHNSTSGSNYIARVWRVPGKRERRGLWDGGGPPGHCVSGVTQGESAGSASVGRAVRDRSIRVVCIVLD